jgi:hypothetical protein
MTDKKYKWDLFLSHASEDKDACVRPLAKKLIDMGIKIWYDEFEIDWGDSIREKIDHGLTESRFAIVILSPDYFKKSWTSNELNGYFTLESKDAKRILPIWFNVTIEQVRDYSPILADRVSANFSDGIDNIMSKIAKRLNINFTHTEPFDTSEKTLFEEPISWDSMSRYTLYKYGHLGIDEYWQAEMLDNLQNIKNIKIIKDVDDIIEKVHVALAVYIRENPVVFTTGTDFITKSIGFYSEEFRANHNFAYVTELAFKKYKSLIKK